MGWFAYVMTAKEQERTVKNIDLGKTQITDNVRVSSAALHRVEWQGSWWLVETWIFSDDPRQRNVQVVHGECSSMNGERPPREELCATARRIHAQMVDGLRRKFSLANTQSSATPNNGH